MSLLGFLLRASRGVVALSVVAAMACGIGGVALIAMIHAELGRASPSGRAVALAFGGLCLLVATARVAAQAAMTRLGQGAVADLAGRIARKVLALPLERFEAIDASSLVAVLTEDIVLVSNALVGIPLLCINGPLVLICLAYVGWLSPMILLCGSAFAALAVLAYLGLVSPAMRQLRASRSGQDVFVGHVRTLIDGFRELKQHRGRGEAFLDRALAPAAAEVRDRAVAGQTLFALAEGWAQLAFFGFLGYVLFVVPSVRSVDRATLGGVVLVVLYIMGPLDVLLNWLPVLGRARASLQRVEALLPTLEVAAAPDATTIVFGPRPYLRDALRLEGVTYAYRDDSGGPGFALGPLDLTLRPGEVVILAGGNGSGKTTLVKVLAGLYPPRRGAIQVDDRQVGEGERAAYRQLFSVLFADGHVFKDFLGLERPGLDLDEAARAGLERMGLGDRVKVEASSYSTTELSQGQRRRLALLNARLEDRPVVIFDEWAANQDPHFKRAFYREILPELRAAGKALLVISHDEEYHDAGDRLLRLVDGRLVEASPAGRRRPAASGVATRATQPHGEPA